MICGIIFLPNVNVAWEQEPLTFASETAMTTDNRVFSHAASVTGDINDNSPGHDSPAILIIIYNGINSADSVVGNVGSIGGRFYRGKGKKRFSADETRRLNEAERGVPAVRLHRR